MGSQGSPSGPKERCLLHWLVLVKSPDQVFCTVLLLLNPRDPSWRRCQWIDCFVFPSGRNACLSNLLWNVLQLLPSYSWCPGVNRVRNVCPSRDLQSLTQCLFWPYWANGDHVAFSLRLSPYPGTLYPYKEAKFVLCQNDEWVWLGGAHAEQDLIRGRGLTPGVPQRISWE